MGFTVCSDDDEPEPIDMYEYIVGHKWSLNGGRVFNFYKNHLVFYDEGAFVAPSGGVSVGARCFGSWHIYGDQMITTFTACSKEDFNMNLLIPSPMSGLHLSDEKTRLVIPVKEPYVVGKDRFGNNHYWDCTEYFVDYTDESEHDGALHGTWKTEGHNYVTNQEIMITLTINADGTARFVSDDGGLDLSTTYTTKDGHVTFEDYVNPGKRKTFIYLRNEITIQLYDKEHAFLSARWYK